MSTNIRIPRPVAFAAMSAALLSFFVAAGAPTPIFPLYEHAWNFPPALLTIAFGVYAVSLIVALLTFGSLSDHVGRRPLLIGALALELVAMTVFLLSPSVGWLIAGRVLQGFATGVASATFGAAVVELAPENRKKLGAVMTSLATTAGLGLGALFAGVVALAIPDVAATTVWVVLVVFMALGTLLALLTPETSTRRPGALASLRPRISVPAHARRLFVVTAPTIAGVFLVTGLFLGLIPSILPAVFDVTDPIISGGLNFAMFGFATLTAAVSSGVKPHRLRNLSNTALALGAVLLLAGVASGQLGFAWAAAVVSGIGGGSGLSGSTRGLVPQVEPHERGALFAAFFTVAYVSLSSGIIGGGFLAAAIGVEPMAIGYLVLSAAIGILGLALGVRVVATGRIPTTTSIPVPAK